MYSGYGARESPVMIVLNRWRSITPATQAVSVEASRHRGRARRTDGSVLATGTDRLSLDPRHELVGVGVLANSRCLPQPLTKAIPTAASLADRFEIAKSHRLRHVPRRCRGRAVGDALVVGRPEAAVDPGVDQGVEHRRDEPALNDVASDADLDVAQAP